LNVGDLTVGERDLQVSEHIDLLRTEIYDLLRFALDRLHVFNGQAERESWRRRRGIANLASSTMACFTSGVIGADWPPPAAYMFPADAACAAILSW
jgi:hypothetical protein